MRNDPTDNGGLFIGRRRGTARVRFRAVPERGGSARQRLDAALAAALLALIALINLTFWGPIPLAWLWVGAQVQYRTGSVSVGIFCAFVGMLLTLMGGLVIAKRVDHAWILVRRAASHDQREGVLERAFPITGMGGGAAVALLFPLMP